MLRKIEIPAPELTFTPDLQEFSRADLVWYLQGLRHCPKVVVYFGHGMGASVIFTGAELVNVLAGLQLNNVTSATGFDGDWEIDVFPVFKKQYQHGGKLLPVFKRETIWRGCHSMARLGGCLSAAYYHPNENGWGFAGFTMSTNRVR